MSVYSQPRTPFIFQWQKDFISALPMNDFTLEKAGMTVKERQEIAALRAFALQLDGAHKKKEYLKICKAAQQSNVPIAIFKNLLYHAKNSNASTILDKKIQEMVQTKVVHNFTSFQKKVKSLPPMLTYDSAIGFAGSVVLFFGVLRTTITWLNVMVNGKKVDTPVIKGLPFFNLLNLPLGMKNIFLQGRNAIESLQGQSSELASEASASFLGSIGSFASSLSSGLAGFGYLVGSGLAEVQWLANLSTFGMLASVAWLVPETLGLYRAEKVKKEIDHILKSTGNRLDGDFETQRYNHESLVLIIEELQKYLEVPSKEIHKEYAKLEKEYKKRVKNVEVCNIQSHAYRNILKMKEELITKRIGMSLNLSQIEDIKEKLNSKKVDDLVEGVVSATLLLRDIRKSIYTKITSHKIGITATALSLTGLVLLTFTPLAPLAYSLIFLSLLVGLSKLLYANGAWERFLAFWRNDVNCVTNANLVSKGVSF
jgi:hypothetical protein